MGRPGRKVVGSGRQLRHHLVHVNECQHKSFLGAAGILQDPVEHSPRQVWKSRARELEMHVRCMHARRMHDVRGAGRERPAQNGQRRHSLRAARCPSSVSPTADASTGRVVPAAVERAAGQGPDPSSKANLRASAVCSGGWLAVTGWWWRARAPILEIVLHAYCWRFRGMKWRDLVGHERQLCRNTYTESNTLRQ